MGDINISYETLFELLRREKNREELQKLDESFFEDVANYIKGKEESLEQLKTKQDLFAGEEKEKAEKQIENIKKILKELYERREKKLIEMAIDSSRTDSMEMDTSAMLREERIFYEYILGVLDRFRADILLNLQHARSPELSGIDKPSEEEMKALKGDEEEGLKEIKITHAVPRFIGTDLQAYGPFEEGDDVKVPPEIANVLINKGRAEDS